MPAELGRYGMDHQHYDWSPFPTRSVLRWPGNARVALCVIVTLEHMEWGPPKDGYIGFGGGLGAISWPNYDRWGHREYGHRVGIFRVLDVLDKHGIKPTLALDTITAGNYPYLVNHCLERGCEVMGYGSSVGRMISSKMSEEEEREYIKSSLDTVKRATGVTPVGWLGPEQGESARTPQLLAQAGIRYVCDWVNDEQPYPMKTPLGDLTSIPILYELEDSFALLGRRVPINRYGELLKESFDTLYDDGAKNGRLLALNLHPYLIGQPFRIKYLDEALGHMVGRQGVWAATGSGITDWYGRNPPGKG